MLTMTANSAGRFIAPMPVHVPPPRLPVCPHCGVDFERDTTVEIGALKMEPYGACTYHGESIQLTPYEAVVLWTIVKARGRCVSLRAISERWEEDRGDLNPIAVMKRRVLAKLLEVRPARVIEMRRGYGYRLAIELLEARA
jgi:DNA-binding response OmpR family regulator